MDVLRAKTAGFCMGVSLALQNLENALLRQAGGGAGAARRICTLGPIIHNPQVL
ncbi:MAG: 4-hydroxy-3-methylbut-2-enyl diphosphate reductase, partial [Desulfovibrio sp.]|nr:4-hydroxy-3-methylbut-2-enyl diphosphate reductase [Desulfovibrio sp.]